MRFNNSRTTERCDAPQPPSIQLSPRQLLLLQESPSSTGAADQCAALDDNLYVLPDGTRRRCSMTGVSRNRLWDEATAVASSYDEATRQICRVFDSAVDRVRAFVFRTRKMRTSQKNTATPGVKACDTCWVDSALGLKEKS